MQCAFGRGAKGTGAYPGRDQHTGHLKAAAESAVGEAEVSEGLCCELGHCDPPAGVAGVGGSSAFSIGSASRMQMRRNWQEGCAGDKAKKSYPPRAACWGPSDRTVPEGQAAPAAPHCSMRLAVPWQHPEAVPGAGAAGGLKGTAKVTLELPAHGTETGLAKGAGTAADLEPLCKFTRGYGKANTEESGGGSDGG